MTVRTLLRSLTCLAVCFVIVGCQTGINLLADIPENRLNELAAFRCVTSEIAVGARAGVPATDARYQRASQLYEGTRTEFNAAIEGIAGDVQAGDEVDLVTHWDRFTAAQGRQQELVSYLQEQEGFGFGGGISLLISAAAPLAQKLAKRFVEQKVRGAAANYLRREFMLPEFGSAQRCPAES